MENTGITEWWTNDDDNLFLWKLVDLSSLFFKILLTSVGAQAQYNYYDETNEE